MFSDTITIFVLYDNKLYDNRLKTAWGFSCLLRLGKKAVLFDTGGDSYILLSNMERLGLNPKEIEVVVLSHIHGDHVGGLAGFLNENSNVTVHLPMSFPQRFKKEIESFKVEIKEVNKSEKIFDSVYILGEFGEVIKEQSLILKTANGLLVVTGCAHPGLVNVVRKARELTADEKVYLIAGGFHLVGTSPSKIKSIIDDFLRLGVKRIAPCHCTGEKAMALFKKYYGNNYIECGAGTKILIQ
ncbi:MAG: MBL fold metallo-hydrolase [Thermodesulfobacteriota bacterium]|nr:MBL fold metallo-hydrolase [Thermodesulfobacteriota bacterium]